MILPVLLLWIAEFQAPGTPPEPALFDRARANMTQILAAQPNCVCVETIDRSERRVPKGKFEPVDSLQLEVALVDKREMYAWPGARKFENTDIAKLVPEGSVTVTGTFAGHAAFLFRTNFATITQGDWVVGANGEWQARFPFAVPVERSRYVLMKSASEGITIGYSGEIQIDPGQARVTRILLHGDAIPKQLKIQATETAIEYGASRLGDRDFWLPARSIETVTFAQGITDRTVTKFSACRAFVGTSTVRFGGDIDSKTDSASAQLRTIDLPPGVGFELQFDEGIRNPPRIGDLIPTSLGTDLKQANQTLFPKGSSVDVRLVRWKRRGDAVEMDVVLGDIKSSVATAQLSAIPDTGAEFRTVEHQRIGRLGGEIKFGGDINRPGLGTIYIGAGTSKVPKGYRTGWVTMAPRQAAAPKEERN